MEAPVLTAVGVLAVALSPILAVVALMLVVDSRQRTRLAAAIRQVAVTDAIHRELGAVVAPVVRKRRWRRWQLLVAVPFERPDTVASVVSTAYRAFALSGGTALDRFEIVLSPQERPVRRSEHAAVAACSSRGASRLAEARAAAARDALVAGSRRPRQPLRIALGLALIRLGQRVLGGQQSARRPLAATS